MLFRWRRDHHRTMRSRRDVMTMIISNYQGWSGTRRWTMN
jgi:hypothetical protein